MFAIVANFDSDINQINIKTIFLYGLINPLVYIDNLKYYKLEAYWQIVCKLVKTFHGFGQFSCL